MTDAYEELLYKLNSGEQVVAIAFGNWGWSSADDPIQLGYGEPEPPPVPLNKRDIPMLLEEAEPYMRGWSFNHGYGNPECYATTVWTTDRIIIVGKYGGATWLFAVPRWPGTSRPEMCGGG